MRTIAVGTSSVKRPRKTTAPPSRRRPSPKARRKAPPPAVLALLAALTIADCDELVRRRDRKVPPRERVIANLRAWRDRAVRAVDTIVATLGNPLAPGALAALDKADRAVRLLGVASDDRDAFTDADDLMRELWNEIARESRGGALAPCPGISHRCGDAVPAGAELCFGCDVRRRRHQRTQGTQPSAVVAQAVLQ